MSKQGPERIDVGWIDPGVVPGDFALSIASTVADMQYHECLGKLYRKAASLPGLGRNQIVEEFLQGENPWLYMVDSDMILDKGHVMKLWITAQDYDVKIVSGLAFIFLKQEQPIPSYFMWGDGTAIQEGVLWIPHNFIPDEPFTVAATGMASTLIHRDVFEAVEAERTETYRWFDQIERPPNEGLLGEDVSFFIKAGEAGFEQVLDPNAETAHLKQIPLSKKDFNRFWELNPEMDERVPYDGN